MCNNNVKAIMKKIYSFLFAATALFAAVSCQKEVAPEVEAPKGEKITFTASTEVETKTALHENGKSTIWVAGDQISVFDANKEGNNRCFNIDELSEDAKTATFSYEGEFVKDKTQTDPTVVALYPYQAKAYCDFFYYDRNYITGLNFPTEQTAVEGGFDSKAAFALGLGTMNTMELGFQNLYALLKFTVANPGVYQVTVEVNEGAFIAGDAKVQMTLNKDKVGNTDGEPVFESPVLSIVENGSNTVTLINEKGFATDKTYYIAVAPTAITNISLYFNNLEGTHKICVNSKEISMNLEANKIYNLGDNGTKSERGLRFSEKEFTTTVRTYHLCPTLSGFTEGVVYSSSNNGVAEVDPITGALSLYNAGETTITAYGPESRTLLSDVTSYKLIVERIPCLLTFSDKEVNATLGADFTPPTLMRDGQPASYASYSSSDESVATVDNNGNVTLLSAGETTITAYIYETPLVSQATATYKLIVTAPSTVRLYIESEKTSVPMNIYAWKSDETELLGTWPGTSLTWDSDVQKYYYDFPADIKGSELNFIVNVDGYQTADLKITIDEYTETYAINWKWVYLKVNTNWKQSSAWFAGRFWTNNNSDYWCKLISVPEQTDTWGCVIPNNHTMVIFTRMNSANKNNMNWNNVWNQTNDLTIPTNGNNLYTIASGAWSKGSGTWSKLTF